MFNKSNNHQDKGRERYEYFVKIKTGKHEVLKILNSSNTWEVTGNERRGTSEKTEISSPKVSLGKRETDEETKKSSMS